MKLDKHLSRIIQQKFILPQDRESKLDPSSLAMHKSYVKEKIRKKKKDTNNKKPQRTGIESKSLNCFELIISIHQISSCVCFVEQHIPTVILLSLITFHCLL